MKELESYYNACNALLKAFCEKHEFDYEDAKDSWAANDIGGVACCGDLFFGMDVIVTDLEKDAPKEELMSWYDYELRCHFVGVSGVNYKSWLKGCPIRSEEELSKLEAYKKRVDDAERDFKRLLEEYK